MGIQILKQPPLVTIQDIQWRDGDTNLPSKFLTQIFSCLKEIQRQKRSRNWRNDGPMTCPTWEPFHGWAPNPDTITDAMLCWQTGACLSCPLSGSTNSWPIQMQILTANHWTEPGDPNGRDRGRTEGVKWDCNPIRTIETNWTTQSSQWLNC